MVKILLTFFTSLLLLAPAWGQASVADAEPGSPVVVMNSNGSAFELYVEPNSGNTTSPHQVFVPIGTDGTATDGVDNRDYSFFASRADLPLFTGEVPSNTTSIIFRLNIDVDLDAGLDQLYVAASTGTDFEIITPRTAVSDNSSLTYVLDITEICGLSSFDCSAFERGDNSNTSADVELYFFVSDNTFSEGDEADPATDGTGPIYEINFSNRVFQDNTMDLFDLFKGDGQLTLDYRGFSMSNDRGLYALVNNAGQGLCSGENSASTTETLGSLGATFSNLVDLEFREVTGQVKLKNLENDTCYQVRLFNCDLYGFCSRGSRELQNSPENIEALLEKQACFFFTAGFGEEHPVVNYFQAWRDNTLKKTWLGRQLIAIYYDVAPQYTPFILERPWLQKVIRGIAYVLYGVMQGWPLLLFLLMLTVVQFRLRKKVI